MSAIIVGCVAVIWILGILLLVLFHAVNRCTTAEPTLAVPFRNHVYYSTEYVYLVTFVTGQRPSAGTEANIYVRLHGEGGTSSELFRIDDVCKGRFQRCSIDRFLVFSKDRLISVRKVELHVNAHGRLDQDWYLTEVVVQDPDQSYKPYVFTCQRWFRAGSNMYKHFLVGPMASRHFFQTFAEIFTRGLSKYHLWLSWLASCGRGRQFSGAAAITVSLHLAANLLLFNMVPSLIPHHVHRKELAEYVWPFNLVAFILALLIEVVLRNVRPPTACSCPYHHDWNDRLAAYRNATHLVISKRDVKDVVQPIYDSLLKCLTTDDWKKARGIARGVLDKLRPRPHNEAGISDDALNEVIRSFIYRMAQHHSKAPNSGPNDVEKGDKMVKERIQKSNNARDQYSVLSEPTTSATEISSMAPATENDDTQPLMDGAHQRRLSSRATKTADDDDDSRCTAIYHMKEGAIESGDHGKKVTPKARVLFLSDVEFYIKDPNKDSVALLTLHNCLSRAVAYEVRSNNPASYEVEPNIGLVRSGETVRLWVWLRKGHDVRLLDSILITARPVHAYYMDPSQIRWLWRSAKTDSLLQYVLHCRGVIPSMVKEAIKLSDGHLLQLDLEMSGEHTKFFGPRLARATSAFALLQGAVALLAAAHYGVRLPEGESHEWLHLFGLAILQHIVIFEPLKVVVLSLFAAALRRNWPIYV